jgi:CRISPR-associated exonuclease Cas4
MAKLLSAAAVLALLGLLLVVLALRGRQKRGLGSGETVALDDVTLFSERLQLVGRPDRIVRQGETLIPEEWKSSKRVNHGHRLQLGAYFLLIEEAYGVRPPFGVVVLSDGSRVEVKNTEKLRSEVLVVAENIRVHRARLEEEISVRQSTAAYLQMLQMRVVRESLGSVCLGDRAEPLRGSRRDL